MVAEGEEGGEEGRGQGDGAARGRGWRELEEGGGGWFKQWWEWAELRRVMTP